MNKLCTSILLLITMLGFTAQVFAAARVYDFEIIIFEDTSGKYKDAEQWHEWSPDNQPAETPGDTTSPASIKNIPIGSIGLDKYVKKLRRSNRYNVLVHKSWRQTGLSDNASVSIPIDSRVDNNRKTGIHGEIKLVLGRYLHLYTDLVYQQPRTQPQPVWQTLNTSPYKDYPIKYHRKMRSKELHYIDHPLVGILIMALPMKKNEENAVKSAQ